MHFPVRPSISWALLAMLLCLPALASADAARVLTVAGTATLERNGQVQPAETGTVLQSGDLINVAEHSALQLRFTDESIVALRANTRLRIGAYQFDRKPDTDRTLLELLRGGMRTITGLIGRNSSTNYGVRTTIATVGIRGTHYTLVICDANCLNADGSSAPSGVFGGVTDGRIYVSNQAGEQEFSQQEYFHVASATAPAVRLLAPPAVLSDRGLITRARVAAQQTEAASNRAERRTASQASTSPQLTSAARSPAALTQALRAAIAANDRPAIVSIISGLTTDISTVRARGFASGSVSEVEVTSDNRTVQEIKAELTEVRDAVFFNAATFAAALDKSRTVERLAAAGVYWTYIAPTSSGTGNLGTHYIWGDRPAISMPTTGVAQYQFGGGTAPVDNFGRVGSLSAGRLSMDFSARSVQTLDPISLSFARVGTVLPATSFTVRSGTSWGMVDSAQALSGVTCTGCNAAVQGTINGRFVGAAANGYAAALAVQSKIQGPTSSLNHAAAAAAAFGR